MYAKKDDLDPLPLPIHILCKRTHFMDCCGRNLTSRIVSKDVRPKDLSAIHETKTQSRGFDENVFRCTDSLNLNRYQIHLPWFPYSGILR